jgi:hypothetical protein
MPKMDAGIHQLLDQLTCHESSPAATTDRLDIEPVELVLEAGPSSRAF